jgi:putative ABC transport system permease protein
VQLALTLLGIALGTAVIVAVALANRAATVSFDRSLAALAGPTTHEIRARDGVLSEGLYRRLRLEQGVRRSVPVIRERLVIDDQTVDLVGIDPLALTWDTSAPGAVTATLPDLLTRSGAVLAPGDLARRLGLRRGIESAVTLAGRPVSILPVSIFEAGSGEWFSEALLADISTVQSLAGRRGELDRIQLKLSEPEGKAVAAWLPADVELRRFDDQRQTFDDMTRAFRTNLTAMSLLAVLVGAFLVYNAMAFGVVQRTATFAVLRMVGVTPKQLFRLLLAEAAGLGVIGGALGLFLGVALGQALLVLVAQTVSDLYVAIDATRPDIGVTQLLLAFAVTLAAVLVATLVPARTAARTAPAVLERESTIQDRNDTRILLLFGGILVISCPVLIALTSGSLVGGFVALFFLIAGYSLLCPPLLRLVVRIPGRLGSGAGSSPVLLLALRGMRSALPRTAPAVVALTVAVSATVGVAVMIGSFRLSVDTWLGRTLQGDLYVYIDAPGERLDPQWAALLDAQPGVARVAVARNRALQLDGETLRVLVIDGDASSSRSFDIVDGPTDAAARLFAGESGILVSEPLASRRRLGVNAELVLGTPEGPRTLPVLGVYRDYGSSYGAAVLPFAVYEAYWDDREISSLAVTLAPGADADALREGILALGAQRNLDLTVISNQQIRDRSLVIFDRTFIITDVLRVLVILVAFVGIVSALLALFLERRRDFAVLRATGVTPRQLQGIVLLQATGFGALAGLLALPLGVAMSVLLIDVINRRSFGWSLTTHMEVSVAVQAVVLSILAAALASVWPARRLAGGDLREALYAP